MPGARRWSWSCLLYTSHMPAGLEVVLTGRDPAPELERRADYITEMRKCKHPYDRGVAPRLGVEW